MVNIIDRLVYTVKLLAAIIISRFMPQKRIWLISERGTEARDNGYCFFLYMKKHHPEISSKYVISKSSPDYNKLSVYEDSLIEPVVDFRFMVLLARCEVMVGTHGYYWMKYKKIATLLLKTLCGQTSVMIQHGIIKDIIPHYLYPVYRTDIFTCGAKKEYDFVLEQYNYPEGVVRYTGLCRFDNLFDYRTKRQILLMPTWRSWMWYSAESATDCEWVKKYISLLQNKDLHRLLIENDIQLVFYPHIEAQKYMSAFYELKLPSCISICNISNADVQTLLKESALLITDFSSVFFDFAYMNKPIVFYQFDEKRYRSEQYQEGYLDYRDTFGYWCDKEDDLILYVKDIIGNKFTLSHDHEEKISKFFPIRDTNNCLRLYDTIQEVKNTNSVK